MVAGLCSLPVSARADAPPPPYWAYPPPEQLEPERRWYGWQTLAVDGASIGVLALGVEAESEEAAVIGGIGYFFAAPVVHMVHANGGKAAASMGLRVAPIGLVLLWATQCFQFEGDTSTGCIAWGVASLLAFPAAIAVDAAVLAYDRIDVVKPSSQRALSRPQPLQIRLSPLVDARRGQLGFAARAEF